MVEARVAKQQTFAGLAWQNKGKKTRRERFLAEMDSIIPWPELVELIEPYYPKAGHGRPPLGLEKMLRIYFLQIWFNLSDPAAEEAIYDSESMRRFARIELSEDRIPDETSILNFRHLLEEHELTKAMFEKINALMEGKGLLLRSGTIVDATIIAAPSSTKNATKSRDPEMKQTKKGKNWHFGMKFHVGTDRRGVVHSLTATHAATAEDEADEEGKELALRNEVPRRDRPARRGAQPHGDARGDSRHHTAERVAARARADDLWRPGVLERSGSATVPR